MLAFLRCIGTGSYAKALEKCGSLTASLPITELAASGRVCWTLGDLERLGVRRPQSREACSNYATGVYAMKKYEFTADSPELVEFVATSMCWAARGTNENWHQFTDQAKVFIAAFAACQAVETGDVSLTQKKRA